MNSPSSFEFEKRLRSFLKEQAPSAPPAPLSEYSEILRKIHSPSRQRRAFTYLLRYILPIPVLATLVYCIALPPSSPSLEREETPFIEALLNSTNENDDSRSPEEDWILLADAVYAVQNETPSAK